MTEIKLDIDTALLMLGKTREFYEEKKNDKKSKTCLFNKQNVEIIQNCVVTETEKYFGTSLDKISGFDKGHVRRNIQKLLVKPDKDEPLPIILGKLESRPRPNCKFKIFTWII